MFSFVFRKLFLTHVTNKTKMTISILTHLLTHFHSHLYTACVGRRLTAEFEGSQAFELVQLVVEAGKGEVLRGEHPAPAQHCSAAVQPHSTAAMQHWAVVLSHSNWRQRFCRNTPDSHPPPSLQYRYPSCTQHTQLQLVPYFRRNSPHMQVILDIFGILCTIKVLLIPHFVDWRVMVTRNIIM